MKSVTLNCLAMVGLLTTAQLPARVQPSDKSVAANERPLGEGIRCVEFSPDGTLLAATLGEPKQRGRVVLWNVAQQKQLWTYVADVGVPAVAFTPDGKTMAVGSYDHTAKLLNSLNGRVVKVFDGHSNFVRAVAFSLDGKTLATGGWDQTVKLWDVATGTEKRTLDWPAKRLYSLSFSPGGQWLLAAGEVARVWDANSGEEKRTVNPYFTPSAVFASDGWFFTGGYDGTIRLWNVATGEQRLRFHNIGGVDKLAFSPKAGMLAETGGFAKTIGLFDFTLEDPTPKQKDRISALVKLLNDDSYDVREAAGKDMLAIGFVAEPELRRVMKESSSAEVRIRCRRLREELLTKPRASLAGHTDQVEGLAFSPDGRLLASGSRDGTVRLWTVQDAKEMARLAPVLP